MVSAPGYTTIRKCGKNNSGTNFKIRTIPVFLCRTFHPNYKKSRQGNQKRFPEDVAGPHRKTIKKHPEKSSNTTMGHFNIRRQGLQPTKEIPPDTDLKDKIKKISVLHYCEP